MEGLSRHTLSRWMPSPSPPGTTRILPMQLQIGDRTTDSTGEWEVIGHPYTTNGGKNVHVRVTGGQARHGRGAAMGFLREGHGDTAGILRGGQAMMMRLRRAAESPTRITVPSLLRASQSPLTVQDDLIDVDRQCRQEDTAAERGLSCESR